MKAHNSGRFSGRRWIFAIGTVLSAAAVGGLLPQSATAKGPKHPHHPPFRHHKPPHKAHKERGEPLTVSVFSPLPGAEAGHAGAGFVIDLAIDASSPKDNALLSEAAGYKPYFNDPSSPTFHPGPDPGAPGLVVLLSTTENKPGTPFAGPNTNLAGLFQINGTAIIHRHKAELWSTWQVGKALFGSGPSTLTVYVVKGTAPTVVTPETEKERISNVAKVRFTITP